jgi:hypothetical protein
VTADGRVLTASPHEHADLSRAARGGAPGWASHDPEGLFGEGVRV